MVQKILTLCDRHAARGAEVDAELPSMTIAIDGRTTEIDLCAEDKAEVLAMLAPYFEDGRRPGRSGLALPSVTSNRQRRQPDENVPRTPSGAISRSAIQPSEDGKYYCDQPNCPRAEWLMVDGERRHGEPFRGPQGIYQHLVHSHGIRRTRTGDVSVGLPA